MRRISHKHGMHVPAGLLVLIALTLTGGSTAVRAGHSTSQPSASTEPAAHGAAEGVALQPNVILTNRMVSMRDGVRLATDIYMPAREGRSLQGPFPVILQRTPYNKAGSQDVGVYFAQRGYVVVEQDTRGRFASEGTWRLLTDDGRDGADTCKWIGTQPWSNREIGMMGGSYVGGVQHALALQGCPFLKTIIPVDAAANPGYAGIRYYGAFELRLFNWIMTLGAPEGSRAAKDPAKQQALERMRSDRLEYLARLPLVAGQTPLKLAPEYESWLISAMRHGGRDDFWNYCNVVEDAVRYQEMPVYLVGGWYDSWGGATSANYIALAKQKRGPIYLIMGPWVHTSQTKSAHGQVEFGPAAAVPQLNAWLGTWFDHWLKNIDNDVGRSGWFSSPVRIFVMGTGDGHKDDQGRLFHGGFWRDEREWPLARTAYTALYLHPNGLLSTEAPGAGGSGISFTFDPRHPVPTIGGNTSSAAGMLENGGWDQRGNPRIWNWRDPIPLSKRPDVVVFETAPLQQDVEVTGEISVTLWASSSARDTDFTAKLIDEYSPSADWPEGFALNLEDGIVRGRFRDAFPEAFSHGSATEHLLRPGQPYKFTIRLYPTSNIFKKGHRIRLDVSSSNYPRFDVNPNTGEPVGRNRHVQSATNTLHLDGNHASFVTLPVIPAAGTSVSGSLQ